MFTDKIITSEAFEMVSKYNSHLSENEILKLVHIYIALRETFPTVPYNILPIKNGFEMNDPIIGRIKVYFQNDTNKHLFPPFNEKLIQEQVNPKCKTSLGRTKYFYHFKKVIYIHSENAFKSFGLPNNKKKVHLYDKALVVAQIKSYLDYFKNRYCDSEIDYPMVSKSLEI